MELPPLPAFVFNFVQCITFFIQLFEEQGHYDWDIIPPFPWDLFSQCVHVAIFVLYLYLPVSFSQLAG